MKGVLVLHLGREFFIHRKAERNIAVREVVAREFKQTPDTTVLAFSSGK